ncbi:MAG: TetR family transcriptional regulator [Aestuariivirgaceae bacterium]|nr:TetR family transcriptional regulator [Aestuariivirgaceae bacterium]
MDEVPETAIGLPRTAPKQARRIQLIEATIDVLAEKGFSKLTISDVARKAGLSHGIVNFHFISKDELLRETIIEMESQYCGLMQQARARAAGDPAASIRNRAETEFCDELSTPRIIRAWAAFRSEAPEMYREISTGEDQILFDELVENCRQIGAMDAVLCASIIDATLKGLIQRKLLGTLSIQEGLRIALACLHAVFPNHFPVAVSSPPAI